jgi:Ca-activated chloride channel family protein
MQRSHLTLTLSGLVLLSAVLAPDLLASPRSDQPVSPPPLPDLHTTDSPDPAEAHSGHLTARAALDQSLRLPGDGSDRFLVIELAADELAAGARGPVHTAVVVDTSGSMSEDGKIDYARRALHALAASLGPADSFSLVQFDSTASVLLPQTPVDGRAVISREIDALYAAGGTAIAPGLHLGYQQLQSAEVEGTRRLLLLSDGLSGESASDLAAVAAQWSAAGVSTSTIGLGLDFDDRILTAVADAGGGAWRYVDDPVGLAGLFAEELDRMTRITARGVQVEVTLDGARTVAVYGYEEFDGHRTLDGYSAFIGDMSSGQTRKVVARISPEDRVGASDIAEVTVRFTDPETGRRHRVPLTVRTATTTDAAAVTASLDTRAGRHAARALAGETLSAGIEHWRAGDNTQARAVLTEGEAMLTDMIARFGITDLDDAVAAIRQRAEGLDRVSATSRQGRGELLGEQLMALGYVE